MDNAKNIVEAAGFRLGEDGKVRNDKGKLVKHAVAEQVQAGNILSNFSMDDLRKKKQRLHSTGTLDMVTALREISPAIEILEVGQTARIPMPKTNTDGKNPKRAFVMGIVTKLNNLTSAGREWAGKVYDSMSDPEGDFFYVCRLPDTEEPHVRKTGAGRKKSVDSLNTALEKSRQHLAQNSGEEQHEDKRSDDEKETDEIMKEDASIIHH